MEPILNSNTNQQSNLSNTTVYQNQVVKNNTVSNLASTPSPSPSITTVVTKNNMKKTIFDILEEKKKLSPLAPMAPSDTTYSPIMSLAPIDSTAILAISPSMSFESIVVPSMSPSYFDLAPGESDSPNNLVFPSESNDSVIYLAKPSQSSNNKEVRNKKSMETEIDFNVEENNILERENIRASNLNDKKLQQNNIYKNMNIDPI